mmetsp:Transcript_22053/g.50395  ORF Transcript_22053/g.50395 Transcript_22053/m.50395 type:complete len:242 (+) Transcript_22053:122-847(+)
MAVASNILARARDLLGGRSNRSSGARGGTQAAPGHAASGAPQLPWPRLLRWRRKGRVASELQPCNRVMLELGILLPNSLQRVVLGMLQKAAHLPGAALQHLLRQPGVLHGSRLPGGLPLHEPVAEHDGRCRQMRRRVPSHLVVNERQFEEVLRKAAVGFAAAVHSLIPLQEVHSGRSADHEVQGGKHRHFHLDNFLLGVCLVRDIHKVVDVRRVQLLELGRDEEGGYTHQLQVPPHRASLL